ncbi:MAG: hypothetical protein CVU56_16895 [Deltaproteobacteria bacterium HGW-Deltaproteobacteria-14]|jgi:Kef-type K+ transport system membrane component KefB|nr:MAG: hypothetical protein CVU56_16895 [Deltaproteobacteria bacterium HGW-Deltaproteobacteria-14]
MNDTLRKILGGRAVKGVFVLGLLIAAMAAMLTLRASVGVSAGVTFAAIGFVVLAAYAMAELASTVGLPRVTGYILAGIGLGPSAAELMGIAEPLIPRSVVVDMRVFNELALALIALEAGLELDLGAIRRFKRTLASIILFKIPLAWLFVGGAFVLLAATVFPVASSGNLMDLVAIGLVLGALAVGTSPAVSVAVISESGIKGKISDLILSFAVFKDVVMVVMLAIGLAVARILVTDGASFDGAIVADLGARILASVFVGLLLGAALIAWMRWVRWELILILLVIAYGINPVEHWIDHTLHVHIKPLLVFITAGFTVANFSRYGHDLHKPLGMLSLPVFVIFFTTAGAGLELTTMLSVLPLAASLFVIRAAMMYVATRLGGRLAREPRPFTDVLWLGFISQAGVALVLLAIAVGELEHATPVLAEDLRQVAFALIALNLLVGPVLLRIALRRGAAATAAGTAKRGSEPAIMPLVAAEPKVAAPVPPPDDPTLQRCYVDVTALVDATVGAASRDAIGRWREAALARLDARDPLDALEPVAIAPFGDALHALAQRVRDALIALPVTAMAALTPEHLTPHLEIPAHGRLALAWTRLRYALGRRQRRLGLRSMARAKVEGRLVVALSELLGAIGRAEARRLDTLDRAQREARGDAEPAGPNHAEARADIERRAAALESELASEAQRTLAELSFALRFAGTPTVRRDEVRYSRVAARVDGAMGTLQRQGARWDEAILRIARRANLRARLLAAEHTIQVHARETLAIWETQQRGAVLALLEDLSGCLARARDALEPAETGIRAEHACESIAPTLAALDAEIDGRIVPAMAEIRLVSEDRAMLGAIEATVREAVPQQPESVELALTGLDLDGVRVPADIPGESKPVAATIAKHLTGELTWSLTETRASDEEIVSRVAQRVVEIGGGATIGLNAGVQELRDREADDPHLGARIVGFARESLGRAARVTERLRSEVEEQLDGIPSDVTSSLDDAFARIYQRLLGEPDDREAHPAVGHDEHLRRALRRAWTRIGRRVSRARGSVGALYRRFAGSELARRARVRSGFERWDPARMSEDVLALEPSHAQLERMPYVLARLFTPNTLDSHHLLGGMADEVAILRAAHARFTAGTPVAVLVRGAAGSGKTSMARVALKALAGRDLVDIGLDADHRSETALSEALVAHGGRLTAHTFEAVSRALRDADRRVVVLDGLEQVFVRTADGLELVRGLLRVISATRRDVMWVVSVDEPTARLLEPLCDLPGYFTDHVTLAPQSAAALGALIEARCRLSGFDVAWPAEAPAERRWWRRLSRRRSTPTEQRQRFLRELAALSGGNIRDALTLFVNAIEDVGPEEIRLAPLTAPSLSWFDQLGRDAHRLLAACVICGTLSLREAREVLLLPRERVASACARLVGAGLLVPAGRDAERLTVRPHIWRRVVDLLIERNLIANSIPQRTKVER